MKDLDLFIQIIKYTFITLDAIVIKILPMKLMKGEFQYG